MPSLASSQNKGLSGYQRRASWLCAGPSPPGGREAGSRQQRWKTRGCYSLSLRDGIFHKTVSRLLAANDTFLRSWMVDIHQDSRSLRSGLLRRRMAHLRRCFRIAPGKPSGQDTRPSWDSTLSKRWSSELLTPGKDTKRTPNPQRLSQNCV